MKTKKSSKAKAGAKSKTKPSFDGLTEPQKFYVDAHYGKADPRRVSELAGVPVEVVAARYVELAASGKSPSPVAHAGFGANREAVVMTREASAKADESKKAAAAQPRRSRGGSHIINKSVKGYAGD